MPILVALIPCNRVTAVSESIALSFKFDDLPELGVSVKSELDMDVMSSAGSNDPYYYYALCSRFGILCLLVSQLAMEVPHSIHLFKGRSQRQFWHCVYYFDDLPLIGWFRSDQVGLGISTSSLQHQLCYSKILPWLALHSCESTFHPFTLTPACTGTADGVGRADEVLLIQPPGRQWLISDSCHAAMFMFWWLGSALGFLWHSSLGSVLIHDIHPSESDG